MSLKRKELENTVFNHYLIEYLLCSKDIYTDLENIDLKFFNAYFALALANLIKHDKESNYYDLFMHKNIEKLLDYLKENEIFKDIIEYYNSYEKLETGNFYESQFSLKYDDVYEYSNNKVISWNIDDLRESVRYDFKAYNTLISSSDSEFISKNVAYFLLDNNFIYFLKKLMKQYGTVLENETIKNRISDALVYNICLLESIDENKVEVVKSFNSKNSKTNKELDISVLEKFTNDTKILFNKISENKEDKFTLSNYEKFAIALKIEDAIIKSETINSVLLFDHLNDYINNINCEVSPKMKHSLYYLLNNLREEMKKNKLLNEYNRCLSKLNSIKVDENLTMEAFFNIYYGALKNGLFKTLKSIYKNEPNGFLDSLDCDIQLLDYINGTKEIEIDEENLLSSINRFLYQYPEMFSNSYIHDRIIDLAKTKSNKTKTKIFKNIKKCN